MSSESVVLTQSTEATSTMSASPLTTPLRKSQNGQSMPPDIDPIATPSQDSINPCEVTTPSSPSSPILPTSSRALTELRSSPTSTSDSDTGSEALQGKISNPKRRRSTKSGSVVRKRVRVSQKHPSHGMVEGAMIGNKAFGESSIICRRLYSQSNSSTFTDVPRQQPLRQPEEDKSKANQRFTRQIKDIISRVSSSFTRFTLHENEYLIDRETSSRDKSLVDNMRSAARSRASYTLRISALASRGYGGSDHHGYDIPRSNSSTQSG